MTPALRKRLLIGAAGLIGLLIVALLAAPSLVDLDARKAEVIAAVKKATGRDLVLDGPVSLSLLPIPTVDRVSRLHPEAVHDCEAYLIEPAQLIEERRGLVEGIGVAIVVPVLAFEEIKERGVASLRD